MSSLKGKEHKRFEDIKHIREDGSEYWSARELAPAFRNIIRTEKKRTNHHDTCPFLILK